MIERLDPSDCPTMPEDASSGTKPAPVPAWKLREAMRSNQPLSKRDGLDAKEVLKKKMEEATGISVIIMTAIRL